MEPYEFCSRYPRCSVNACPLDPLMEEREGLPDDPEPSCPMAKADRERTWGRLPKPLQALLPYHGLTRVEWSRRETGRRVWASLGSRRQAKAIARLKERAFCSDSGTSTPPGRPGAPPPPPEA